MRFDIERRGRGGGLEEEMRAPELQIFFLACC